MLPVGSSYAKIMGLPVPSCLFFLPSWALPSCPLALLVSSTPFFASCLFGLALPLPSGFFFSSTPLPLPSCLFFLYPLYLYPLALATSSTLWPSLPLPFFLLYPLGLPPLALPFFFALALLPYGLLALALWLLPLALLPFWSTPLPLLGCSLLPFASCLFF